MKISIMVSKAGKVYGQYRFNSAPKDQEPVWENAFIKLDGLKLVDEDGKSIVGIPNHKLTLQVIGIRAVVTDNFDFSTSKKASVAPASTEQKAPASTEATAVSTDDDMPM